MARQLTWDEGKRRVNLSKHGLDFSDALEVLESRFRLDVEIVRSDERRTMSISYSLAFLAVLTVVHVGRGGAVRIISFRYASKTEREIYDAWLENECDEP